MEMHF